MGMCEHIGKWEYVGMWAHMGKFRYKWPHRKYCILQYESPHRAAVLHFFDLSPFTLA